MPTKRVVVGAAITAMVGLGGLLSASVSGADDPKLVNLPIHDGPVQANELWSAFVAASRCLEGGGVMTAGPIPLIDGSGISYAYPADAEKVEVECAATAQSMARRFSIDSRPEEFARLVAIRAALMDCLASKSVPVDRETNDGDAGAAAIKYITQVRECVARA